MSSRRTSPTSATIATSTTDRPRVLVDFEPGMATVSLNRSDKHNALDIAMLESLVRAIAEVRRGKDVRVVILRGLGPSFCSGLDFASVQKHPLTVARLFATFGVRQRNVFQQVAMGWRDLPMPVIAAIHGSCYGGGLQIALGADFRVGAPDAGLSIMEVKLGMVPDMSATVTLRELLPLDVAKKLAMTGQIISGTEALKLGLITELATDPLVAARALAKRLIEQSPDAVAGIKRLFNRGWNATEFAALGLERRIQLRMLVNANQREAVRATLQKRVAVFKPRRFGE